MSTPAWYAIQSVPSREQTLDRRLTERGHRIYFAQTRKWACNAGGWRQIISCRLPGYLFALCGGDNLSVHDLAAAIFEEESAVRLLGVTYRADNEAGIVRSIYSPMRDMDLIERWITEAPDGVYDEPDPREAGRRDAYVVDYMPGQMLSVVTGPFAGITAAFVSGTPYKIILNFPLLGRENLIHVDHGRIEGAVLAPIMAAEPGNSDVIKFRQARKRIARSLRRSGMAAKCGSMEQTVAM